MFALQRPLWSGGGFGGNVSERNGASAGSDRFVNTEAEDRPPATQCLGGRRDLPARRALMSLVRVPRTEPLWGRATIFQARPPGSDTSRRVPDTGRFD